MKIFQQIILEVKYCTHIPTFWYGKFGLSVKFDLGMQPTASRPMPQHGLPLLKHVSQIGEKWVSTQKNRVKIGKGKDRKKKKDRNIGETGGALRKMVGDSLLF